MGCSLLKFSILEGTLSLEALLIQILLLRELLEIALLVELVEQLSYQESVGKVFLKVLDWLQRESEGVLMAKMLPWTVRSRCLAS